MSPLRVLFVCTANICRSPYMEKYATSKGIEGVTFSSAGTHGYRDRPINDPIAVELRRRGIDPEGFLSRPLTDEMVRGADIILTAERRHHRFVLDEHPSAFRRVFTLGQFAEAVRREPGRSGLDLLIEITSKDGTPGLSLDVKDPYARGPEAAAICATHISELLDIILPVLAPEPGDPGSSARRSSQ